MPAPPSGPRDTHLKGGMRADANPAFTLRQFVEESFAAYCQQMEDRYNGDTPWPEVEDPLTAGRSSGY
ncbi:hypothetical protein KRMM14A1259_71770 [Krasilnikovia sp. MM14-A1259]